MSAYREQFAIGSPVRIASRAKLEAFRRDWAYHNPLTDEQLAFADRESVVAEVGFYHGGDPLYVLADIPGVWHEPCLTQIVGSTSPARGNLADQIHAAILARGYSSVVAVDSPEAFGSWYRDYERLGQFIRLVWDGRDGWFVLQGGPNWRDLALRRPEEFSSAGIEQFLNELP